MKKLVIVSMGRPTGETIRVHLEPLLKGYVDIEMCLLSELNEANIIGDLIVCSNQNSYETAKKHIRKEIPIIICRRVIDYRNIDKLIALPHASEVLLVNDTEYTAFESIEQLIELGLDHVVYRPFYPGLVVDRPFKIAVTLGEPQLVPENIPTLIDIGCRIPDFWTIFDIFNKLGLSDYIDPNAVTRHIKDIVKISKSIESNRSQIEKSENMLEIILNTVDSGICFCNENQMIVRINSEFESIIGKKKKDIVGKSITTIFEKMCLLKLSENGATLISLYGRELLASSERINDNEHPGFLLTLNEASQISKLESRVRMGRELRETDRLQSFDDYLTVNSKVEKMLIDARKFAMSDSTILIEGENGTGKEILAQAIHMKSRRKLHPFVPVNIGAISHNLLESELFGYVEGSFTGALKGGRAGLFETANKGTIFIDEIGEAPIDLQVKLLRVLQEKKIRRVGGFEEIPVDIRIIAATNKNLYQETKKGNFREDLFFRLNILPIKTIPLRERQCDITYLIRHFSGIYFNKRSITNEHDLFDAEALHFFKQYPWSGNIRELINVMEYLSNIDTGNVFTVQDLPHYMHEGNVQNIYKPLSRRQSVDLDEIEHWILLTVSECPNIGRIELKKKAIEDNIHVTEAQIRRILSKLKSLGLLIDSSKGSLISDIGKWILS